MNSFITDLGKKLGANAFKESVKSFVLIGSDTENDLELNKLLDPSMTPIKNIDIDNNNVLSNYIITKPKSIDYSTFIDEYKVTFSLTIDSEDIDKRKFVYAVALMDEDNNIISVTKFIDTFNSIDGASVIIKVTHTILESDTENTISSGSSANVDYVTREEFLDYINTKALSENKVSKEEMKLSLNELDSKKADKGVIGSLENSNTVDKSNIIAIINEIISGIGSVKNLNTDTKQTLVDSFNSLKEIVGNGSELKIVAKNLVDAINILSDQVGGIGDSIFADGVVVSSVRWDSKSDQSYIGNIEDYLGSSKNNIVDALNEIYNIIEINKNKIHEIRQVNKETNYKLFSKEQDFYGNINISFSNRNIVVCNFSLDVNITPNSIKIYNVFIDESLKNDNLIINEELKNYIIGFAVVYKDGNLSLSIKTDEDIKGNKLFDTINIDYSSVNVNSNLIEESFSTEGSIAIREGSGNYIDDAYKNIIIENNKSYIFDSSKKFKAKLTYMIDDKEINSTIIDNSDLSFIIDGGVDKDNINEGSKLKINHNLNKYTIINFIILNKGNLHLVDVSNLKDLSNLFNSSFFYNWTNEDFNGIETWDVSNVTDMSYMFYGCRNFDKPLNNWNVSNVTNMRAIFYNCTSFNQPLNNWNVSNVTDMSYMFYNCTNFNQSLDNWNVSNVTSMYEMFFNCTNFNQSLNNWDLSKSKNISNMFYNCTNFNAPLDNWILGRETIANSMFSGCISFNQPINSWDVSNVTNMIKMFAGASSFNQPLDNWDVSNVTDMRYMFTECNNFNGDINNWNTNNVTNMDEMFYNCYNFNQPLDRWNTSSLTNAYSMFYCCVNFNQNINNWNTSNLVEATGMFESCYNFNQPLNSWDTSNVVSIGGMFYCCVNFNQPLDQWDVSNVTNMNMAFMGCTSFNQDISNWNTNSVVYSDRTFYECPIIDGYKPYLPQ